MTAAIDISRVTHRYRDQPVVDDLAARIEAGSFCIVIGPNGSGKTTLLKLIAGIESLQGGDIRISGTPLKKYSRSALAREIAFVPQQIPSDLPYSVTEVVLMGRAPHQGLLGVESPEDLHAAREAVAFTGLEAYAHRRMDELSGGERQRVFIARAICQEPKIMLLDEPTASLDLAHQVGVMDLMERLQKEKGTTIMMVSHDINLAAMYGDMLILLKEGRLVERGAPGEVLTYRTLEDVYGCTLLVDDSPLGDFPRITLVPRRVLHRVETS